MSCLCIFSKNGRNTVCQECVNRLVDTLKKREKYIEKIKQEERDKQRCTCCPVHTVKKN